MTKTSPKLTLPKTRVANPKRTIVDDFPPHVRENIAIGYRGTHQDSQLLSELSEDPDPRVRYALVTNSNVHADVYTKLENDQNVEVRNAVRARILQHR